MFDLYTSFNTDFYHLETECHDEHDTEPDIDRPMCANLASKQSEISHMRSCRKWVERGTGHVRRACKEYNKSDRRLTKAWLRSVV